MNNTITFSDDPSQVWLSPKTSRAARALLFWDQKDLAFRASVNLRRFILFEDTGAASLSDVERGRLLRVLLDKVCFSTVEGVPGVYLKREAAKAQGRATIVFGGPRTRSPKL